MTTHASNKSIKQVCLHNTEHYNFVVSESHVQFMPMNNNINIWHTVKNRDFKT
jgi:hypothetical protein